MKIILGSSSPWRAQILRDMGYDFTVMEPNIDEKAIRSENPQVLTMKLAMAKSRALWGRVGGDDALLITADQVVACGGVIREKPRDAEEAKAFLRSYREDPAVCVTAVYGIHTTRKQDSLVIDEATVWFQDLTGDAIRDIIADGTVMGCAGSFAAIHPPFRKHIQRIEGEWESAAGFPKTIVRTMIESFTM